MKMMLIILCLLITTVCGKNFTNVEFNEVPEEKLLDAICRSFQKPNSKNCEAECTWENQMYNITDFRIVKNVSEVYLPRLKCKEEDMVNIFWENNDDFAYFLQIINTNNSEEILSNVTICTDYTVYDLEEDTTYSVRLWAASLSKKEIVYSDVTTIKTSSKNYVPSPVTETQYKTKCYIDTCDTLILWGPNADRTCLYDLVWFSEEFLRQNTINVISDPYQFVLKNLTFDTHYTVNIIARNGESRNESPKKTLDFHTKTCLEVHHSLDKCVPEAPQKFEIYETLSEPFDGRYNIHLTWQKPDLLPTYYTAQFANLIDNNTAIYNRSGDIFQNSTGDETELVFKNVKLADFYQISLIACAPLGCSKPAVDHRHRAALPPIVVDKSSTQHWKVLLIVLVPLLAVLTAIVIINCYCAKKKRREDRQKYFMELPEPVENFSIDLIKKDFTDHWELDPHSLHFESIIGEGAFGVVRRAHLEKSDTKVQVAVKMLKESPNSDDIRQFTQEINIMKSVGHHRFIVSLIGCITEVQAEGPLLVVEYCSRGDLQTYLRNAWTTFCELQQEIDNTEEIRCFANQTYDFENMNLGSDFIINPKHLLSIARQVALGMEHLAKTRVVHRDLAARNVLVCEDHTVKVSDFGLSRDVYQDNVYCKSSRGKVPIRWMAIESLTHQRYTTQSDVWSFGILLWEIVTLGETPYASIPSSDLLEFLKNGSRMGRPSNCSQELYAVMKSCWKSSPKNRPTFTEICKSLEDLLQNVSDYLKLENLPSNNDGKIINFTNLSQSLSSTEYYIKPVNTLR